MLSLWGAARGPAVLFLVLALALTLSGCELTVEEPWVPSADAQRNTMSARTELPAYEVAVSAIDFDPPLRPENLVSLRPIKLLAAVENKGALQLSNLVVSARLGTQKGDFSAQDKVHIDKLSPGETKVVEFQGAPSSSALPRSPLYRVRVSVDGPQLDTDARDNGRELIVRVGDPIP